MFYIKCRGSVEPKETKGYKVESNKTKGDFKFNQTDGELQELNLRTKSKYVFYAEDSEDEEKKVEYINESDQTVEVKLVSSSTAGNPRVKIITSMGDIVVELFEDDTPNTVANFIELCEAKFFDDIRFHRIIKGFMIQGGCPYAKGEVSQRAGSGDAGYKFADEFVDKHKFDSKGLLAMANSGPNTNGSQFFITLGAATWLNGKHTIFGKVIDGMDIVDKIGAVQTSKPGDRPVEEVYIKKTEITQKRNHEYKVKKD
ncbi:MAG: peptidylprolyl isomerase [Planctomycetes bacterium]|nr:peptidylprolyl isomerase [Planctomycetota bacterium]